MKLKSLTVCLLLWAALSFLVTAQDAPTSNKVPAVDPLVFSAAEQGEIRTIIADQNQIGQRIRQLHDELAGLKEDDEKSFVELGLKLQRQVEKQRASEQRGAKFIEKVKPRCPDCILDFDNMRLVKPPANDTAANKPKK